MCMNIKTKVCDKISERSKKNSKKSKINQKKKKNLESVCVLCDYKK